LFEREVRAAPPPPDFVQRGSPGHLVENAVNRKQFATEQVELTAEQGELAKDLPESLAIVATEVGNGLEVGLQMAQQPDHLDVAMRLGFQPPARANTV
jgi:hypothetical protein